MYKKITYRAGNTIEVTKCYTHRWHGKGIERKPPTKSPEKIAEANRYQQIRKLNRIFNANFEKGDMYYTLTYKKQWTHPTTEEELLKEITDHIRRMRETLKRRGMELKYIYVYSMGKRGTNPHAHIVTNIPMGYEEHELLIKRLWLKKDAARLNDGKIRDEHPGGLHERPLRQQF